MADKTEKSFRGVYLVPDCNEFPGGTAQYRRGMETYEFGSAASVTVMEEGCGFVTIANLDSRTEQTKSQAEEFQGNVYGRLDRLFGIKLLGQEGWQANFGGEHRGFDTHVTTIAPAHSAICFKSDQQFISFCISSSSRNRLLTIAKYPHGITIKKFAEEAKCAIENGEQLGVRLQEHIAKLESEFKAVAAAVPAFPLGATKEQVKATKAEPGYSDAIKAMKKAQQEYEGALERLNSQFAYDRSPSKEVTMGDFWEILVAAEHTKESGESGKWRREPEVGWVQMTAVEAIVGEWLLGVQLSHERDFNLKNGQSLYGTENDRAEDQSPSVQIVRVFPAVFKKRMAVISGQGEQGVDYPDPSLFPHADPVRYAETVMSQIATACTTSAVEGILEEADLADLTEGIKGSPDAALFFQAYPAIGGFASPSARVGTTLGFLRRVASKSNIEAGTDPAAQVPAPPQGLSLATIPPRRDSGRLGAMQSRAVSQCPPNDAQGGHPPQVREVAGATELRVT